MPQRWDATPGLVQGWRVPPPPPRPGDRLEPAAVPPVLPIRVQGGEVPSHCHLPTMHRVLPPYA